MINASLLVYTIMTNKRRQVAEKYNVQQFQSIDDLLQSVEAVSIAVPTEFHYEIGLACIRNNVHMLMEKPITSTVAQADDLIDKASKAGVKLQVGHIELYNPFIQMLLHLLADESIVGVTFHRISPSGSGIKDVDVVKDLMIHDIYILNKMLKDDGSEFCALGEVIDGTPKHAVAFKRSSQGITAQLTASFMSKRKVRNMQILTKDAFMEADLLSNTIKMTGSFIEETSNNPVPVTKTIQFEESIKPLHPQLLDFISSIKSDKDPSITGEDGREVLITANQITDAIIDHNELFY